MDNKNLVIKCPKCGYEYLPAEIFFPDTLLGEPSNIIRDEEGKVEFFEGNSMNLKEEFVCYNCDCTFIVEAKVSFNTKINSKVIDFNEDYITTID